MSQALRAGVDVGGTNTDAVLLRGGEVLAWAKRPTTADVQAGLVSALSEVLGEVPSSSLSSLSIGTTHFTNALVQARELCHVAAVRVGLPATTCLPPFTDWPAAARAAVEGPVCWLHGGHEYDGREISQMLDAEIEAAVAAISRSGVEAVAVSAVFSPVRETHELLVAERLLRALPHLSVTCSHEIGRLGFLERENAALLNAALRPLAARTVDGMRAALAELGVTAPLYFTQNDGTLMDAAYVRRFPALTIASGPTNSMRGAAALSGLSDAVVIDVGGTTTDCGLLVGGFPHEASFAVRVARVRTNFRMPDVLSVGLGGGSRVRAGGAEIGPDSVGHELTSQALVFGGEQLTATDVAVAAGRSKIGDVSRVTGIDRQVVAAALATITRMTELAIDAVKLRAAPVPVLVVGGGSLLLPDRLAGAERLILPPHAAVANAVGAAIAEVSGEIERVYSLEAMTRSQALADAEAEARSRAVEAGAEPGGLRVADVEEVPLAYLPGSATRVRVRVVGPLADRVGASR